MMHIRWIVFVTCAAVVRAAQSVHVAQFRADDWNASVTVDWAPGHRTPVSPVLYGIFFEEIGHAGEGGLYAELIQDRSFDALAAATGFLSTSDATSGAPAATRLAVDWPALARSHPRADQPVGTPSWAPEPGKAYRSKTEYLAERRDATVHNPSNDIIIAWQPLAGTTATLTKDRPLNDRNAVSMELTAGGTGAGGIINFGYWGINVVAGVRYTASLYLRSSDAQPHNVTVSLLSADLSTFYHNASFDTVGGIWHKYTGELETSISDTDARFGIFFDGPGTIIVDSVSLFPSANVEKAKSEGTVNPWPFREDLLQALKDLKPGFMRFPGGCYIEGDWLRNAFRWKDSIGPNEARPGHMNGIWGYWSTDGLGLFEYMQLAEELNTEPIWVINNGVAHGDSIRGADIWPWVQDALDSLEFITGAADSKWGAVRASMGRQEPWKISYMAIGNEDCWKPWYLNNYLTFFGAIRAAYPSMRLIANCHMGQDAPTDLWDWHIYTNPTDMFNRRHEFDGKTPENSDYIFASEYAVTDGGGWGNLIGAVSEAAFMTGMERNSRVVLLGAYAPLFVHTNNRPWPTNMIVIDNHQWYGIPSYYVQKMFREAQGTHYLPTTVVTNPASPVHEEKVAASATCQDESCSRIALKLVNFSSYRQRIAVRFNGLDALRPIQAKGEVVVLTSGHPEDENTFDAPRKVYPTSGELVGFSNEFLLRAEPWSVTVVQLHLAGGPSAAATAVA